jgi:hypothetical protein
MKNDIPLVVEVMRDALLNKLGEEVDLIFQYGSYLKGTAHKFSDIDLSYVPVHEATWESITVMVGETMIDLYPMHWSHLERMAEFDDVSSSVLLHNRIVYQRTEEAAERFCALAGRLKALQEPEALPKMIRKAQQIFQSTGYAYYLLRHEATAGHRLGCIKQAQSILETVLYCLAVCNQACIDTRKMAQVLALSKLPVGFADSVERITQTTEAEELLLTCENLLATTRDLLQTEQGRILCHETTYPAVFDGAYPELKADLQRVILACEERDMFRLKSSFVSLYHELSRGLAQVISGVEYSGFNALSEYEQCLTALGFPALLPYVVNEDFAGLHQQCQAFGQHLEKFLSEGSVQLSKFATLEELQKHLGIGAS